MKNTRVLVKIFFIIFITSVVNFFGADEDGLNEDNSLKSVDETDISENKNNWNTRKWGSIFL